MRKRSIEPVFRRGRHVNNGNAEIHEIVNQRITVLSDLPETPFIASWYEEAHQGHFWMEWRFVATLQLLRLLDVSLELPQLALDLGCGNGVFRSQIESASNWTVDGADLDMAALRRCSPGRGRLFQYDVTDEHASLVNSYDVVFLYDVLEHIDDTMPFLRSLVRHVKPGGLLVINVPALESLKGEYDRAAGHVRRYSPKSLTDAVANLPLTIVCVRYWGMSLVPLVALRKLLTRRDWSDDNVIRSGFRPPAPVINSALRLVMRTETRLLHRPPVGSSLLLAARRDR